MTEKKEARKPKSQIGEIWRRLKMNKTAMLGLAVLIIMILLAVFADQIADYNEVVIKMDTPNRLKAPSRTNWLGTDNFGRDIFARLVHGARVSLQVGIISVGIALLIGGTLGAIAGYYGGRIDNIIMRFMDVFLAIPSILLAIAIVSSLGNSMMNLMIAVGIASMPTYARVVRSSVISVVDEEYIEAARAIGASDTRIILKHIIPNALAPVIVQSTMGVALAIISTAGLSFLGLGIGEPAPEWGAMLSSGRTYLRDAPHLAMFPGLAIMITVLSLNLLGDGLRDALDPRLRD